MQTLIAEMLSVDGTIHQGHSDHVGKAMVGAFPGLGMPFFSVSTHDRLTVREGPYLYFGNFIHADIFERSLMAASTAV